MKTLLAFLESGTSPPLTIKQRAKLIRKATPDCLEPLYEMSNRRCDLCGHPIQDLICASLDHSTPVVHFARNLEMPIDDAVAQTNHPQNLRVAHANCNAAKLGNAVDAAFGG